LGMKAESASRKESGPGGRRVAVAVVVALVLCALGLCGCGTSPIDLAAELDRQGDLQGAEALYRSILAENANDIVALSGLASDLMLQQKYDEALPIQEKVVSIDPKDVQTFVELGFNYLNHQERPADAVRVLSEAVKLDGSARNLTFMAQAQVAANDAVGAEASLRRALAKDPKYPHAYAVLRDLLVKLDRSQDALQVENLARQQGVTIESSQ
jgi:tetratricopeptide (TPR) repeat protein